MSLPSGSRIGPYDVTGLLGTGGMGEVYGATDTRLGRAVAIKVLPESLNDHAERVARFEREAKVLASLNHPNIAAIYGLEDDGHRRYLVLELVEGTTLGDLLLGGPIAVDRALEIGRDIARAVEAAHDKGIIHRDLKPANIKFTPEGHIKVLDFGLAKALDDRDREGSALSDSPTLTARFTAEGVVLGTAAYMSPEQARGRRLDKRTDIWSFGCVLYECLTGRRPFDGDTASDLIARIIERDPDFDALPPNTPHGVRNLLVRCLVKDPRRRLRDIGDALIELEEAVHTRAWSTSAIDAVPGAARRHRTANRGLRGALLFLLGALAMFAVYRMGWATPTRMATAPQPVSRVTLDFPTQVHADFWELSPDGRAIVWSARADPEDKSAPYQLYLRQLNDYTARPLPSTRGVDAFHFTPDGSAILVMVDYPGTVRARILRVPVDGRPASPLCDVAPEWGSWATTYDGGLITFLDRGRRYVRVDAGGKISEPRDLAIGDLPGGLNVQRALPGDRALLVTTYIWQDGFQEGVGVVDLAENSFTLLIDEGDYPRYHPDGLLTFSQDDTLYAVPFDDRTLRLDGRPRAVVAGMRTSNAWDNAEYGLGNNGTLVYMHGGQIGRRRRLIIVDRDGIIEPWSDERRSFEPNVALSHDGRRLAVVCTNVHTANFEVWITDARARALWPAIAEPSADVSNPSWSPDGMRLAFQRESSDGNDGLYVTPIDDPAAAVRCLPTTGRVEFSTISWSPDGRTLLAAPTGVDRTATLQRLDTRSPGAEPAPLPLPSTVQAIKRFATASPDGRLLAYGTTDAGSFDIKLCALDDRGPSGPSIVVTREQAGRVRWHKDGTALYWTHDDRLFESRITAEPALTASPPEAILDLAELRIAESGDPFIKFDVLPDGRFVFVQKGEDETDVNELRVVLNWVAEINGSTP